MMAQKKNITQSKGGCSPSAEVGTPHRGYGSKAGRNNLQPQNHPHRPKK